MCVRAGVGCFSRHENISEMTFEMQQGTNKIKAMWSWLPAAKKIIKG